MAGISCSTSHAAPSGFPAPPAEQPAGVEAVNEEGEAVAVLAGGCFWCTEAVFERLAGVKTVVSGYAGGTAEDADYKKVSGGLTEHAEAIKIVYDPAQTRFLDLLEVFFAVAHNPTHVNRQGNDHGPQYRSAVFYANDAQKAAAEAYIQEIDASGVYPDPVATKMEPLNRFYEAEPYHQDYAANNPDNPYVRGVGQPKVDKLEKSFPERLKK
ncbi:peptide-methionine (S)-S-oxide reductase MsrA [Phycisphaera mikurensis]|uniref:Peptide methionine sulfoxide reductase MsrA n=1 Tax=Phycisphaera mikurensis (strain NBRC 102666 / KCTC 22515 / FYK2301M01) TaxID=1142394 RepID=I0IAA1_PHYMF|nr:peptide-methionine (S)-S-oxide reductase MsrA [Phycisphaera mikurensis]MBB6441811.1 peptide-methionine (S)-S-oxide reductase [Phycisphaera mikurensis]BAM02189.1 peptide methionine sulfoxide reductase MsrA [Phycisphaera mikurensis NBRC 102666]